MVTGSIRLDDPAWRGKRRAQQQDEGAAVTSTNREDKRALRKLASQAGSAEEKSGLRIVVLIAIGLMASLAWKAYSHWQERPRAATESAHTAAAIGPSRVPPALGSTAWSSAHSATHDSPSAAAQVSKSDSAPSSKTGTAARDDRLEKRVVAVEDLARRGDPGAAEAVLDALHDEDWRVRSRVMDAAVNAYVAIPESALVEHAQSDPSEEVRFLALAGIAARIDPAIPQIGAMEPAAAEAIGRQALSDASEQVRWQAQQILDALDAKNPTTSNDQAQAEML